MTATSAPGIYTVSEFTRLVKDTLEETIGAVWVEGEISNYTHHSSGHRYFTLKDEGASLKAVMWRQTAQRTLNFDPEPGMRVRAFGNVTVYAPHGVYQIVVQRLVPMGIGPLEIAFQKLKEKLLAEGLFEEDEKRPIPELPESVGIITSPTGAAIRDMVEIIAARFSGLRIVHVPTRVQGDGAALEIVAAIQCLNTRDDVDVIIAGRGGGSLEDLWPFNEEIVARAIFDSGIPVISAVGHEVDYTIADFVADLRAATPTAAAQIVTEGWARLREALPVWKKRLRRAGESIITDRQDQLRGLSQSHALQRPGDLMQHWFQRLDTTTDRARAGIRNMLTKRRDRLQSFADRLGALSPEAVLKRGYSVTRIRGQSAVIRDATAVDSGATLETRVSKGTIISTVTETEP